MKRIFVIGRRRKGRHANDVRDVGRLLSDAGCKVEWKVVQRTADLQRLTRKAVKAGVDVVVAVGGDGTVIQVATALAQTRVPLGIIPTGTGNLLAGNLGIPRDLRKAARAVVTGRARWLDLGRATVDGVPHDFAVACGIGFDATVMQATGNRQKLRWGRLAYLANAIGKSGGIRNVAYDITLDGVQTTTQAAQVFIANFGGMPAPFEPRRPIRPNDGLLDVIVVRASGGLQGLLAAWEALRQTDLGESSGGHVFRAQAREVRVETKASLLVEADGDVIGRTPLLARVLPRAVRVIAPRT